MDPVACALLVVGVIGLFLAERANKAILRRMDDALARLKRLKDGEK